MKKLLFILLIFTACSKQEIKTYSEPAPLSTHLYRDTLPAGIEIIASAKGGIKGPPKKPTPPPPPTGVTGGMIFITFDGHLETNTGWRGYEFWSNGSDLPQTDKDFIIAAVANYYARYNVIITNNEFEYQQYTGKKIMAQVTDDVWNPQLPSTGLAFHGSMQIGGNTCYIFATNLYKNPDWISKLVSHEVGHTCGLYHQEVYNPDCTHVTNYRDGAIMGVCFYSEYCRWVYGQTWSCETWEDDDKKLTIFLGLR